MAPVEKVLHAGVLDGAMHDRVDATGCTAGVGPAGVNPSQEER